MPRLLLVVALATTAMVFAGLAVMAPEINAWPLPIALVLGVAVSITGVVIADRKPRRRVPLIVSAVTGTLHTLGLLAVGTLVVQVMLTNVEERFVIPDGYMGEVAVIFDMADGVPEQRSSRRTVVYDIPPSGLLLTRGQPVREWIRDRYFYRKSDGSLVEIDARWNTTIHDTPENRWDSSIGIYLRGGVGQSVGGGCNYQFIKFMVGTKGFMLNAPVRKTFAEKMHEQSVSCRRAS